MAEEKNTAAVAKNMNAVKKEEKKLGFFKKIGKWFREMRSELKKVIWPTRQQLTKNSLISLGVMISSSIVVWGCDALATKLVQLIIKIPTLLG